MMNLKSCLPALMLLLGGFSVTAQTGMPQIPNEAFMVTRISGSSLQSKMPLDELNELPIFKEMFAKGFSEANISSMQELGIDFNKDSYMYAEYSDSITYLSWMLPLNNFANFEKTFLHEMGIKTEEGSPVYDNEIFTYWNEKAVFFSIGMLNEEYKKKHGLGWGGFYEPYAYPEEQVVYEQIDEEAVPMIEDIEEVPEIVEDSELEEVYEIAVEEVVEENEYRRPPPPPPPPANESYSERKARENALLLKWHNTRLVRMLPTVGKPVLSGRKFASVIGSKSDVSAFVDYGMNEDKGVLDLMADMYGAMPGMSNTATAQMLNMSAGSTITSDLNFGEKEIRWHFDMHANKQFSKAQKDMMSGKMSKEYLTYMNSDALIGYYTMNINTAATLEFYTDELATWEDDGSEFGPYPSLIGELLGLMLDEEEIAEFFPGSMAVTFSDFGKRMVEYSTYEYDENMQKTKVTKEKEETMPVFLAMAETHKPGLVNKLMRLSTKGYNSPVRETEFGFEFSDGPMPVYFFLKDDMFFVGNDLTQLRSVKNGTFKSGLNSKHKKAILNNNSVLFFDAKELIDGMAGVYQYGEKSDMIAFAQGKAKNIMVTTGLKNSNTMSVDAVIELPEYEQNGWTYMMNLINSIYEYQTRR